MSVRQTGNVSKGEAKKISTFIKREFSLYELGIRNVLGGPLIEVYEVIRRYTWRKLDKGSPKLRKLYSQDVLAAKIRRGRIAEFLGIPRDNTISEHVTTMRRLGWLRTQDLGGRQNYVYVLGKCLESDGEKRDEVFYFDGWVLQVEQALKKFAHDSFGPDARIKDIPFYVRVNFVQDLVDQQLAAAKREEKRVEPVCTKHAFEVEDLPINQNPGQSISAVAEVVTPEYLRCSGEGGGGYLRCSGDSTSAVAERGVGGTSAVAETRIDNLTGRDSEQITKERIIALARDHFEEDPPTGREPVRAADIRTGIRSVPLKESSAAMTRRVNTGDALLDEHVFAASPSRTRPGNALSLSGWNSTKDEMIQAQLAKLKVDREAAGRKTAEEHMRQAQKRTAREKNLEGGNVPIKLKQEMNKLGAVWNEEFKKSWPTLPLPLEVDGKTRGLYKHLLKTWGPALAQDGVRYLIRNWSKLSLRFFKKAAGGPPSIGILSSLGSTLIPESQIWKGVASVVEEWQSWEASAKDDFYADAPGDLDKRYQAAKKTLEGLGL